MYIPNDDTQNYPFCRLKIVVGLDTQLNKPTNQNSTKYPKLLGQRKETSVNSPMSPPLNVN